MVHLIILEATTIVILIHFLQTNQVLIKTTQLAAI